MDLRKTQLIESVFAGGGEMGARMRAVDWSTTVLGAVEQWPQSLRACVRIMLGAGHPMLFTQGQPISTLTHQLFTFHRKNYLEECYFAFSYSPIPDDNGSSRPDDLFRKRQWRRACQARTELRDR